MFDMLRTRFGFGPMTTDAGSHPHGEGAAHGHTHGVMDATIATTARGIWAIKWSFVILAITAALQLVVVYFTSSVALLADTIHNIGDAGTAVPLWIAFLFARRRPNKRFTYGYGRVEDLAGVAIVGVILFSAIVAGWQAIDRLINPEPIAFVSWVAIAGILGFLGNEAVAVFRIRVGREINSAALVADGYHARTDGLTSLAVVLGAIGVWLGFPLADPLVGLAITLAIFGIVWQSSRAVFTRMLDGVEPGVVDDIRHAAEHVPGVREVQDVKVRWIGHRMHVEMAIGVEESASVATALTITDAVRAELHGHLPALAEARISLADPAGGAAAGEAVNPAHRHPHAPAPFKIDGELAAGSLAIVDTPNGERLRLTLDRHAKGLAAVVVIDRPDGPETLPLEPGADHHHLESAAAPAEPHDFEARLILRAGGRETMLPFRMEEPHRH